MNTESLNYTLHNNGWTVLVNEDLRNLSDSQIAELRTLVATKTLVVFSNQDLTPDEEVTVAKRIGRVCQNYRMIGSVPSNHEMKRLCVNEFILRNTGAKDEHGRNLGAAGVPQDIVWHADKVSRKIDRYSVLWMHGVSGTQDSCTSFLNSNIGYDNLSEELKSKIQDKRIICGNTFRVRSVYDLVFANNTGTTAVFFPFLQSFEILDVSADESEEITNQLKQELFVEENIYHHYWQDGDILISDQWLALHKRWAFDKMEERVVHRIDIRTEESKVDSKE